MISHNPITNPELAQAVADMAAQGSRASREAVLDIVISKARFLAPVTISPAPEQQESAPLGEGTAIQFQLLPNQEGQPFFPRLHLLGGAAQAVRPQKPANPGSHL